MPPPRVTVAIATLAADESLRECLHSLESQTLDGYEVVVVDNSGAKRVEPHDPPQISGTGNDDVEFLVSANPGQPPRPLAKVASGGELSRISLALQVAAVEAAHLPCLVFDEVDAGVGGAVAEMVGRQLHALASERSAEGTVKFRGEALPVRELQDFDFESTQIAFFAASAQVAAGFAPKAAALGNVVVDSSAHFRYDEEIPLVVEGAMLIEPTESVGRADLDAFIDAMKDIDREATEDPALVTDAPHSTRIGRLDEATAARKPVLRWHENMDSAAKAA